MFWKLLSKHEWSYLQKRLVDKGLNHITRQWKIKFNKLQGTIKQL